MNGFRAHKVLTAVFVLTGLCLGMSVGAQANSTTIPFMTGTFPGEGTFVLFPGVTSPDGQWFFDMFTAVVEGQTTGTTDCGNGICVFNGSAPITGGTAGGDLFHWNGSSFDPFATFNGWVTGGDVQKTEVYVDGLLTQFNYQYHYDFVGAWTNQWNTFGNVYGTNMWDGIGQQGPGESLFTLTTSTPEPGTITLLGASVLALARGIYKKLVL